MKGLFKISSIAALLLSSSVFATEITIDIDTDADPSNGFNIDEFVSDTFDATSYYIDEDGSGFVDNGEFVFDFGLGVDIVGFAPGAYPAGYGTDWIFQADYLIYGNAIVTENGAGTTPNGAYDDFGSTTQNHPIFGDVDVPNEQLSANILDGLLNLFVVDVHTGNQQLAQSFTVSSLTQGSGVVLDMALEGLWAIDDMFYANGTELNDAISGGANWNGVLKSQLHLDGDNYPIPGQWTENGGIADGDPLAYYGQNTQEITQAANDCPDGNFGCGSGIPFSPVTEKWREVRDTIRAAGKDGQGNHYDILARTTELGSRLTQNVPEPTSIAVLALGLLGLASAKRRKTS
ncbi:PEP-CTERM sorting domain-containing protein [Thalassotalea sp. SU-HH00458]|uniref:PEP-CTERM sorting domain-containing protein n=1 Tax=Thalassotalea sp. SU-HH00458 TaxID=3127657 RepID=UPI0033659E8E